MKHTLPEGTLSEVKEMCGDDYAIFANEFNTLNQALMYPEIAEVMNDVDYIRVEVYKDCYENGIYYNNGGKPIVILFRVWSYVGKKPNVLGIMKYVVIDDDVRPENVPFYNKFVVEGAIRLALATTKLSKFLKHKQ